MNPIDPEMRSAVLTMLDLLAADHPRLRTGVCECRLCRAAGRLLACLDAEQREYGPAIDVTDPSWLRDARKELVR